MPDGLRLHDLRHTAAAFMIYEGAHLELVRRQLGHTSISVTQKYAHLYPSQSVELFSRMDARRAEAFTNGVGLTWGSGVTPMTRITNEERNTS